MSMWKVCGVSAQPEVFAEPWIILEAIGMTIPDAPPPYRFVVCFDRSQRCGRMSTLIVERDFAQMRVLTESGRVYVLTGPPSLNADAWYVWTRRMGALPVKDVSGEYWPGHTGATLIDTRVQELGAALEAESRGKSAG